MSEIAPPTGYNDRVRLHQALPLRMPFTLNVFPTNACNLKCTYCVHSMGGTRLQAYPQMGGKPNMSIETFKSIVEKSAQFNDRYKLLSFMGHGEPLLNRDLPEMIRLAKRANLANRLEIISNGLLLNKALSDEIIDAGLTNLRVSLQGITSSKYLEIGRVPVDFEELFENLSYFHNAGISRGTRLFVKILDCSLDDGESETFYKLFDSASSRMFIEFVKPVYDGVSLTKDLNNLETDRYGKQHARRHVCPLPFFTLSIWPNGDVSPCDAIYQPVVLGNVNTHQLTDMFSGHTNNMFRLDHLHGERPRMAGCQKCCAPDDVSDELDALDEHAAELAARYEALA